MSCLSCVTPRATAGPTVWSRLPSREYVGRPSAQHNPGFADTVWNEVILEENETRLKNLWFSKYNELGLII